MNIYKAIGIMSGTSLDGVDLAYCIFVEDNNKWEFQINVAKTVEYSKGWKQKLSNLKKSNAEFFSKVNVEYGHYLGSLVREFINETKIEPDIVASHGHTVFHQPENKLSVQIGDGPAISSYLDCPVVFDFRSLDVALGGQGAPLVPLGDKLLFSDYDFCINIGGFANISFEENNERLAFDICPANIVLNEISQIEGNDFDRNGEMAKLGSINSELLAQLNNLDYYKSAFPKSLGMEWVMKNFKPIVESFNISNFDKLRTLVEHISIQISNSINKNDSKVLLSGGGTKNSFLVDRISFHTKANLVIPAETIIDFKEAMIFAFLGVLCSRNQINCLSSVTGASRDSVCGIIC